MRPTTPLRRLCAVEPTVNINNVEGMHRLLGLEGWKRRWGTSSTPGGDGVDASPQIAPTGAATTTAQRPRCPQDDI